MGLGVFCCHYCVFCRLVFYVAASVVYIVATLVFYVTGMGVSCCHLGFFCCLVFFVAAFVFSVTEHVVYGFGQARRASWPSILVRQEPSQSAGCAASASPCVRF